MPPSLSFEPTTACNLRCPDCVSGLRSFTRPRGNAALSSYEQHLEELAPYAFSLTLYFQGEPFIHPEFLEMVRLAKKKRLYVSTSSNGHFFDSDAAKQTVLSGLDRLIISVDGATQETYEAYRREGQLDKVREGIKHLSYWKNQLKAAHPRIIIQVLAFRHNEKELQSLRQLGLEWGGDEVRIKTAQILDLEKGASRIPTESYLSRYKVVQGQQITYKADIRNKCRRLWFSTVLTWDGRVLPCCFDKDADHLMGLAGSVPFRKIWRGPWYQTFRKSVLADRKQNEICANCTEGCRVWVPAKYKVLEY